MYMVLLGPPGAGKGTQGEKLKDKLDLIHIAMGNLLRETVKKKTPSGEKVRAFMEEGKLVPDGVILELLKNEIELEKEGFILDGFPRNLSQARKLDELLDKEAEKLDLVINLEVKKAVLIKRLRGRLICSECGKVYHKSKIDHSMEICKDCGASLLQRNDDNSDIIKKRIEVYLEHTHPLIDYYRKKKILRNVQGEGTSEEVFQRIMDLFKEKKIAQGRVDQNFRDCIGNTT